MGYTCCVPGCKTGYKKRPKDPSISVHTYPSLEIEPDLAAKWVEAIFGCGGVYVVNANSRVCSLHFNPEDFISESIDSKRKPNRPLNKR